MMLRYAGLIWKTTFWFAPLREIQKARPQVTSGVTQAGNTG
jgi:hypothetical protein